jgi:hypothetical protein
MQYAEKHRSPFCMWSDDGLSVVIKRPHEFMNQLVPKFFRGGAKFPSFQRKLYRWGFRIVSHFWEREHNGDEIMVYRAIHFQRNRPELIQHMCSVTARTTRRKPQQRRNKEAVPLQLSSFSDTSSELKQQPSATTVVSHQCNVIPSSGSHQDSITSALATQKATDESLSPLPAALSLVRSSKTDSELLSLCKMYDLEPNPIL